MKIKVTRTVDVTLVRVEWRYGTWEDYYVQVGDCLVGVVSEYSDARYPWTAMSQHPKLSGWRQRNYLTRDAAVAALVRFAAKNGAI